MQKIGKIIAKDTYCKDEFISWVSDMEGAGLCHCHLLSSLLKNHILKEFSLM